MDLEGRSDRRPRRADGYVAVDRSVDLEGIDLELLCELATVIPTSDAVARLRERLREPPA